MADPTLYLFDGHNLLHAGGFRDAHHLTDALASFVASQGAQGIVVFDGAGDQGSLGPLQIRFAPHADSVLERLAAEHRGSEVVCLVSSDAAVRGTSGQEVRKLSTRSFLGELRAATHVEPASSRVRDRLDAHTRERLERLRRGR
jgi:predicted RNA-binding protein with PIN domain